MTRPTTGRAPLQYGKVRIFQEDGHGGTAFIGEDWGKFTPLDDEMRLYVGVAQDIVVHRTIDRNDVQRDRRQPLNRKVVVKFEIENFKDKPAVLDISKTSAPFATKSRATTAATCNGSSASHDLRGQA